MMLEQHLRTARVIAVTTIDRVDDAVPLAQVLCAAGVTLIEVTLRSSAALDAIRAIRTAQVALTVAAGTVRTPGELTAAAAAGAALLISPGSTAALIEAARNVPVQWLPGASTPSEVMALADAGYAVQKLFPATLPLVDALAGPFPDVHLVPTGGIDATNITDYLRRPNVVAVAGSWIAPRQLIRTQAWQDIHDRAVAAVARATRVATEN
jgi:2-dehydro-3-deoxyphosphogluconate aldolase / (4S)-4-hydroxy-2-oxoglutarate aldolase